jgi:hypothetical protein
MAALIPIPTRFENILASETLDPAPLIVPVENDLKYFDALRRVADTQNAGVIVFPVGASGGGKTTAVYSAASLLPDLFAPVCPVPHTINLRSVAEWLHNNLPSQTTRATLVLLDGREASDDAIGLKQLVTSLNQLVRGRPDLLFVWPTVDDDWRRELVELAQKIGGVELAPDGYEHVEGPPPAAWPEILNRILIQLDHGLDDVALDQAFVESVVTEQENVGRFLGRISSAIANRVDEVQLSKRLPRIIFVVTADSSIVGEANRLRRAGSYLLKPQELISYSPRSVAGKYWQARAAVPEHHLGYIIALFQATLTTMTPSSLVYACAEYGDADLKKLVTREGLNRSQSNAKRTFESTDFYRLLIGSPSKELTSTMKGKTAASTLKAHASIQAASKDRHKAINQAICQLAEHVEPHFKASLGSFEVDLGEQDLYTDAVIPLGANDLYLEFHHLSAAHARAASIASYVMDKLRLYAIRHNIIPR